MARKEQLRTRQLYSIGFTFQIKNQSVWNRPGNLSCQRGFSYLSGTQDGDCRLLLQSALQDGIQIAL